MQSFVEADIQPCTLANSEDPVKTLQSGCGFVALRPKSTAMVIAGRSVHLTTLFPEQT